MGVTVWRRLAAVLFPERCAACGEVILPGEGVCDTCRADWPVIGVPVCSRCGLEKAWCECRRRRRHYERVVASWYYDGAAARAVLRMKASGDPSVVAFFADTLADTVQQHYDELTFDGVVFIPVTRRGFRRRGYNPGELIARAVAHRLSLPCLPYLRKIYETTPQKSLTAEERGGNLLGAFDVTEETLEGKTFLLIDDVVTTGATLDECAKMLKIYGAEAVYAATVAATRKTDEERT